MKVSPRLPFTPQSVLVITAHPDDEAFGPGGTLAKLTQTCTVYVICLTDGNDNGRPENLKVTRKQELLASAQILNIKKVFLFGYQDGSLCHNQYHEIAKRITRFVNKLKPGLLITYEPRGVSGHLDHAAASLITSYVFENTTIPQEIWQYCLHQEYRKRIEPYFIHFPPGYSDKQIDFAIDIDDVYEQKIKAMRCHQSQSNDVERILRQQKSLPRREHFFRIHRSR